MCQLLENFSATMTAEMEKMAERELKNLNLQEIYLKDEKALTADVVKDIYSQFKDEQTKAFDNVQTVLKNSCDNMETQINKCTAEVKKVSGTASKTAKEVTQSAKELRRMKCWEDVLYHLSPFFVIIDTIVSVAFWLSNR